MIFEEYSEKNEKSQNVSESGALDDNALDAVAGGLSGVEVNTNTTVTTNSNNVTGNTTTTNNNSINNNFGDVNTGGGAFTLDFSRSSVTNSGYSGRSSRRRWRR